MNQLIRSALTLLASGAADHYLDCSPDDRALLRQDSTWVPTQHLSARRALGATLSGALDAAGLPHVEPPLEYVAACIALMVHPTNWLSACHLMGNHSAAATLVAAADSDQPVKALPPRSIFSACLQAQDWVPQFAEQLSNRLGEAVGAFSPSSDGA